MQDEYVEINGIPTRILTFGKWIDEPFKKNDELILCITGELHYRWYCSSILLEYRILSNVCILIDFIHIFR